MLRVVWLTHSSSVGGSDQVLVDTLRHLDLEQFELIVAGNPNPCLLSWAARNSERSLRSAATPLHAYGDAHVTRVIRAVRDLRHRSTGDGPVLEDLLDSPSPPSRSVLEAATTFGQMPMNGIRLYALLDKLKPDVLHINNGGYPGSRAAQIASVAAKRAGVPRVVHMVHNTAERPARAARLEALLDESVDRTTDLWITSSNATNRALLERRAIIGEVRTIYPGVRDPVASHAATDLGFESETLNVLIVGALVRRKGLATALNAFALLRDRGTPLRVVIAGEGPLRSLIEQRIVELDLTHCVELVGHRADVDALYTAADVLLLASTSYEAFPTVVLEAMAHGLPVVGTRIAGVPEQIADNRTGILVSPGDPSAIAEALQRLCGAELRREMGAAGRLTARERFPDERFVRRLETAWRGRSA